MNTIGTKNLSDKIRQPAGKKFRLINKIIPLLLAGLSLPFFLCGCRIVYIMHAAAGQYDLISNSIQIEEALKDESLDPAVKSNLDLVDMIKKFGETELGLKKTGNYGKVYLKSRNDPIYTISASPRDRMSSVTWWFPVVGRIPYLGFFDKDKAREMQKELLEKNLDVYMGTADAYSTLGWFNDPVTLNLLEGNRVDLVETILHEMTHATIYFSGKAEINEGLANIIGKVGALNFLKKVFGPDDPMTRKAAGILEDQRIFSSFLLSLLDELEQLYGSSMGYRDKLEKREVIFKTALERWERIRPCMATDRFIHFGKEGLNNAYLLTIGLYHRKFLSFERLLKEKNGSVNELMTFMKSHSKQVAEIFAKEWQKQ